MFKERIYREALRLYAGDHVVSRVEHLGLKSLALGMSEVEITLMFVDLRGFSQITETVTRSDLGLLINEHHTRIAQTVVSNGGMLDSMIGDSAIAYWGANGTADHANQAFASARSLLEVNHASHASLLARGWPPIKLMIGLHTGIVGIGNYGSPHRIKYTVLGDAVNLAARLCGRCSEYGVELLMSDSTMNQLSNKVNIKPVDTVRVKGMKEKVDLYTITQ